MYGGGGQTPEPARTMTAKTMDCSCGSPDAAGNDQKCSDSILPTNFFAFTRASRVVRDWHFLQPNPIRRQGRDQLGLHPEAIFGEVGANRAKRGHREHFLAAFHVAEAKARQTVRQDGQQPIDSSVQTRPKSLDAMVRSPARAHHRIQLLSDEIRDIMAVMKLLSSFHVMPGVRPLTCKSL